MGRMHATIAIDQPLDVVYGFFLDLEQQIPAIDPKVHSVVKTGEVEGTTVYVIRQSVLGRVRDQVTRVSATEPNRRIDIDARFGPVAPRLSLLFESTGEGTTVTMSGDSHPIGPFRLVTPLMDRIGQRNWIRRFSLVKQVLEKRKP
jgi:carbon monoxide dehydrogenase subunit G